MIIVMEHGAPKEHVQRAIDEVHKLGYTPHPIFGTDRTVIACVGDERGKHRIQTLDSLPGVEAVVPILQPFKLVGREAKPEKTIVNVGGVPIGGAEVVVMAGPCSVESREQVLASAEAVRAAGARILRGGAFKPRTSPYEFQGLEEEGLKLLAEARERTGLRVVTELMDAHHLELIEAYADMIQIGARNAQNFFLLKAVGKSDKPVLLKRGMATSIKELLMSAEYIMSQGNYNVVLCERGIRTFETYTRNTLDLSAVPVIQKLSHLPVIVDPSHGTGHWDIVAPMSKAAVAAGADGLIIEVHPHPDEAASDGAQSLKPRRFRALMDELRSLARSIGREVAEPGGD
ncbi:MAG TPA: 3-deoxy-7-phosphoheptulonate synthase [Firmicutes bacterium]|nr:3-deoxy-7-phosphoheptulonate synthase [Bacillota bacterium]